MKIQSSLLAFAATAIVGSATADKRKRVFKIYSPEEIQATEEATATRSLFKEEWPPKTPPKEQKPKSMSMSMTLSPARAPVQEEILYMAMDAYDYDYSGEAEIAFGEYDYDYYEDTQEEADYTAYLSLTVQGKLNKLSTYCPYGHGGLKDASPATVDKIETAADVNKDQVLSLTEYQGLPQITVMYCNTKAAVAATKESSGDAKSGKGAGGRKRKRVSRGNMKY